MQAKAIVIATGDKLFIPKSLDGVKERVLTNETLFELKDLPRSIGVIGAGPLGAGACTGTGPVRCDCGSVRRE